MRFCYIVIFTVLLGCGKAKKAGDDHGHDHAEEESTIASLSDSQIKAVGIEVGELEQKELAGGIKGNGHLRVPNNFQADISTLFGGQIKAIHVQVGDFVKKNQVVATLENPEFLQIQEEYVTLGGKLHLAELELARQKELNEGGAGALKNLQNIQTEIRTLTSRKYALVKHLQMMGLNPENVKAESLNSVLVVRSPINGVVSDVFAKLGSYVQPSTPILEVVDNSKLHLDFQVFEKDLSRVSVGQTVEFTLTNNPSQNYFAEIHSIGSSFEDDSKTVSVHAEITSSKMGLIHGMNVTGVIHQAGAKTWAVPNEALVFSEGKYFIFVVKKQADHKHEGEADHEHYTDFEKLEVIKGVSELGYTGVTLSEGKSEGLKIVTKGAYFVNAKMTNTGDGHAH